MLERRAGIAKQPVDDADEAPRLHQPDTGATVGGGDETLKLARLQRPWLEMAHVAPFASFSPQNGQTIFSGSADLSEIAATAQGVEGRWIADTGSGCREIAHFSAVLL